MGDKTVEKGVDLMDALSKSLRKNDAREASKSPERRRGAREGDVYVRERTRGMIADAVNAMRAMIDIALDETERARERIMAATFAWDRLIGRDPIWKDSDKGRSPILVALNQTFGAGRVNEFTRIAVGRDAGGEEGDGPVGEAVEGPADGDRDPKEPGGEPGVATPAA